jgi:hypothetical protein
MPCLFRAVIIHDKSTGHGRLAYRAKADGAVPEAQPIKPRLRWLSGVETSGVETHSLVHSFT